MVCDFAETYHVLDFYALRARLAATLAVGLGPKSRIKQKISGAKADADTLLLALIADAARVIAWQNTKDGHKGRNAPESLFGAVMGQKKKSVQTGPGFDSPEAFRAWRSGMLQGGE